MLDIDVQGVISIKKTDLNPNYLFVKPPSIEELEKRLKVSKSILLLTKGCLRKYFIRQLFVLNYSQLSK